MYVTTKTQEEKPEVSIDSPSQSVHPPALQQYSQHHVLSSLHHTYRIRHRFPREAAPPELRGHHLGRAGLLPPQRFLVPGQREQELEIGVVLERSLENNERFLGGDNPLQDRASS